MVTPQFALIATMVAFAACVQGTIGIGFALIVAPVMAFLRPELLPVSLLFLMIPLNVFTLWREREALDWRGGGWITLGRTFGALAGVAVLFILSTHALNLLVGASTIAAGLVTVVAPKFSPKRLGFMTVGLVTGISETTTGIGGPPLALAYQHYRPEILRATVAACLGAGQLLSLGALGVAGKTSLGQVASAAILVPFLAVGGVASNFLRHRVNERLLRWLVIAFAVISGAILMIRG